MNTHRSRDILDALAAHVLEEKIELVAHLVAYDPIDADPARLGQCFESRRDVNTIAVDVAAVLDDVAEIDPVRNWMRRSSGTPALRSAISC